MFVADRNDLATKLKIPIKNLTHLLYVKKTENCYTSFQIPKKNGSFRTICTPNDQLKDVQRKLAQLLYKKQQEIWEKQNIHPNISHGFEKGKTIITNAKIHKNRRFVLNLDLEDFFTSFHFGRVMGYFQKNRNFKLDRKMAATIAQLTCYDGSLPQGAPTSPIITNLICKILDFKLLAVAKKYKLDYTRYADDLTFSTNNKKFLAQKDYFLKEISKVIEKEGFKINEKKTKLQYRDSKQTVTGLVVNEKINTDRNYFRTTKAMAHSLYTKGEFNIDNEKGSIAQLEGRFSFINQIDKYDNKYCVEVKRNFQTLNLREKEYRKFIFYKIFLHNSNPLLITEGKTDPLYIKAALKKYYKDFPKLICKNKDEQFEFSLHFFKRTKKMKYFFNIVENGADNLKNIYDFYFGGNIRGYQFKGYFNDFLRYNVVPNSPVIMLFDNEIQNKNKPITKFAGYKNLTEIEKADFEKNLKIKMHEKNGKNDKSNLYLITNPLVNDKKECEIEDLFDVATLNIQINGRTFDRNVKKGDHNHFGKNDFANYMQNYETIDFSKFLPLLQNISKIVELYL